MLSTLARTFALDLAALRSSCGGAIGRRHSVPLAFPAGFTLLPVHIRSPLTKDDGAGGYIVREQVDSIESIPGGAAIRFHDSCRLELRQQPASLHRLLGEAEQVKTVLSRLQPRAVSEPRQPSWPCLYYPGEPPLSSPASALLPPGAGSGSPFLLVPLPAFTGAPAPVGSGPGRTYRRKPR